MPANDAGLGRLPTVIGFDAVCAVDAVEAPTWVVVNRGTHESVSVNYRCMLLISVGYYVSPHPWLLLYLPLYYHVYLPVALIARRDICG